MVVAHVLHLPIEYAAYGEVPSSEGYLAEIGATAREKLDAWTAPLEERGWELERVVCEGPPSDAALRLAEEHGAGLIAMGTRGRAGLSSFLLGSSAKRVVQRSACPVLTVRRHGADGRRTQRPRLRRGRRASRIRRGAVARPAADRAR